MSFDTVNVVVYVLFFIGQAVCWYEAGRSKGMSDGFTKSIDLLKKMME